MSLNHAAVSKRENTSYVMPFEIEITLDSDEEVVQSKHLSIWAMQKSRNKNQVICRSRLHEFVHIHLY